MKTIYGTNSDVIDNWIRWSKTGANFNGQNKNKSLFFEGNMLYSYGHHYPLAKYIILRETNRKICKRKDIILVNKEGSSKTTNNHKSGIARFIYAPDDNFMDRVNKFKGFFIKDFENMELNVSDYKMRIEGKIEVLLRSRDRWWIEKRLEWIEKGIKERNKFVEIFKLDFPKMEFKELLNDKQVVKLVTMKLRAKI